MITNDLKSELQNKIGQIKLISIIINKKINSIDFCYLLDCKKEITENLRQEVQRITTECLNVKSKVQIHFKKNYLIQDNFQKYITSYFIENDTLIKNGIKNIKMLIKEPRVDIAFVVIPEVFEYAKSNNFLNNIKNYLEKYFFADFNIVMEIDRSIDEFDDLLDQRNKQVLEDTLNNKEKAKDNYYQVMDIVPIYGTKLIDKALCISHLKKDMQDVYLAGKINFFAKNAYKRKQMKNNIEVEVEKIRYNFEIKDHSGKISAVLFPAKPLLAKGDIFENGQSVIALCDVQEYNERLSIRVKEIGTCELPSVSDITTYNTEIENYVFANPEPYAELQQVDIWQENYNSIPQHFKDKTYVVFDFETTGLDYRVDDIIEIGAVKIQNGKIIETFSTFVYTERTIIEETIRLNGITNETVANAPKIDEILPDFYKFTRGSIMVAHNAEFDKGFLVYHALKHLWKFDNEFEDTLYLARKYFKGLKNYKLKTICEHFGVSLENAHRALDDTIATAKCFFKIAEKM